MKKKVDKSKDPLWAYFIPLFAMLLMCIIYTLYVSFWQNVGIRADGKVISIRKVRERRDQEYSTTIETVYYYKIEYDQSGTLQTGTYKSNFKNDELSVGSTVKILYSPMDSNNLELSDIEISPGPLIAFVLVGLFLSLYLLKDKIWLKCKSFKYNNVSST